MPSIMPLPVPLRGALLRGLALALAAVTILYGGAWMYYVRLETASAELGFVSHYSDAASAVMVDSVEDGGPASRSGLRAGDRIVEVNGVPLDSRDAFEAWEHARADDPVTLSVRRADSPDPASPVSVTVSLLQRGPVSLKGVVENSLLEVLKFYPVVFLTVGLAVLWLRPEDR